MGDVNLGSQTPVTTYSTSLPSLQACEHVLMVKTALKDVILSENPQHTSQPQEANHLQRPLAPCRKDRSWKRCASGLVDG